MEPQNHGTIEPWNHRTIEPWNRVTIGKLHSSVPFSAVLGFAKTTAFGRLDTAYNIWVAVISTFVVLLRKLWMFYEIMSTQQLI